VLIGVFQDWGKLPLDHHVAAFWTSLCALDGKAISHVSQFKVLELRVKA